jgi:4,5-dihydroxyphthalate decarboxylase
MGWLSLTLATHDYDRVRALREGTVRPEGIDLNYLNLPVEEIFWRMCRGQEFDASEMSFAAYLISCSWPDPPFVALPVFLSRFFRHSMVYVNADAGIDQPADLRGKRVGIPEWAVTAIVLLKGIWNEHYGVHHREVHWLVGGLEQTGRTERIDVRTPPDTRVEAIPPDKTLSQMLEEGSIDALFSSRDPLCYQRGSTRVRRLFPDPKATEIEYFRKTGIFPIMHLVVLRKSIHGEHSWAAQELYKAFCRSKAQAEPALRDTGALRVMVPWLHHAMAETRQIMGSDPWPYGVHANRAAIETFVRYAHEQGLIARRFMAEELFAPSTLAEFKV